MISTKFYTVLFFGSLIGSTLCVIPQGEIQIGPIFGKGIFGGHHHKHFEAVIQKGIQLKPLLVKKAILGAGALGAGALAVGGAAVLAKKIPHLAHGWGWGSNYHHQASSGSYGWGNNNGGYYQQSAVTDVKFPASSYPTSASYNNYPSTEYGYPQSQWQGSDNYAGWSR